MAYLAKADSKSAFIAATNACIQAGPKPRLDLGLAPSRSTCQTPQFLWGLELKRCRSATSPGGELPGRSCAQIRGSFVRVVSVPVAMRRAAGCRPTKAPQNFRAKIPCTTTAKLELTPKSATHCAFESAIRRIYLKKSGVNFPCTKWPMKKQCLCTPRLPADQGKT